jgi:hypothetical protein
VSPIGAELGQPDEKLVHSIFHRTRTHDLALVVDSELLSGAMRVSQYLSRFEARRPDWSVVFGPITQDTRGNVDSVQVCR